MSVLYRRKARLVLDTLLIEDLRISFKIKKTLRKQPNTAEVNVYNLNPDHRAALQKSKSIPLILEAGYLDNLGQIFSGKTRWVDQVRDGPNWVTKAECGDGERQFAYTRINKSFAPGARVADVVQNVADSLGLKATGLKQAEALSEQFVQGRGVYGSAASILDGLLSARGFEWSIQDGQLQVLPVDGTTTDSVILLTPDNGLIGSPEHGNPQREIPVTQLDPDAVGFTTTAKGRKGPAVLKVKSLIQPAFKPGRRVKIQAQGINGVFRIQQVEHSGDTKNGDWFSEMECLPVV